MDDDSSFEFNVWTGFADLMLALVLILSLLLFLVVAAISLGSVNLKHVQNNQRKMVESLAQRFNTVPEPLPEGGFGISTTRTSVNDIRIEDDLSTQRITFSDKLLFRPDDTAINQSGQVVLDTVGSTLKAQLPLIKEIQIQGHADTLRSAKFHSNTELAAMRAISVFEYLQNTVGIDPASTLMSATTFGEFKSVQRGRLGADYDLKKLLSDNADESLRGFNRRIEVVLIYKR
jgi:flagellar motor protein MotB